MTDKRKQSIVPVMLNGGRVTLGFREALFAAAARAGTSVNELVLRMAGQQLRAHGFDVDGVFDPGDLSCHPSGPSIEPQRYRTNLVGMSKPDHQTIGAQS